MKYSIIPHFINKPAGEIVTKFNHSFQEVETDVAGLAKIIQKGQAFLLATFKDPKGSRDCNNIDRVSMVAMDCDNTMKVLDDKGKEVKDENGKAIKVKATGEKHWTIAEALADERISSQAALLYTTPSHTPEWERFRIVFRFESPVSAAIARYVIKKHIIGTFPAADRACSSPQFFFYGNTEAEVPLLNEDNCITNAQIAAIEEEFEEDKREQEKAYLSIANFDLPDNLERDEALALMALEHIPPRQPGTGTYDESSTVFIALIRLFGKDRGLELARCWSPEDDSPGSGWEDLDKKADGVLAGSQSKTLGMGSVVAIAKKHGFDAKAAWKELMKDYNPYKDYVLPKSLIQLPKHQGTTLAKDQPIQMVESLEQAESLWKEGSLAIAIPSLKDWVPSNKAREATRKLKQELINLLGVKSEYSLALKLNSDNYNEAHLKALNKSLIWAFPLNKWSVSVECDELVTNLNDLQKKEAFKWAIAETGKRNRITATTEINQRYLSFEPQPNTKLIGLKSQKGTGKSTWYQRRIEQLKLAGKKVLLIVHREKLGQELANKAGVPYLREVLDLGNGYGLCLCCDSLHLQSAVGRQLKDIVEDPNLVVVIDEIEQSLLHLLFSSTNVAKHRPEVFNTLRQALKSAFNSFGTGYVVAADADLTDRSLNFLKQFAECPNAPTEVLVNNWKNSGRKATIYENKGTWLTNLRAALSDCVADKRNNVKQRSIHIVLQAVKPSSPTSSVAIEELIKKEFKELTTLRADSKVTKDPTHPANLALLGDFNGVLERGFNDFKLYNKCQQKFIHDIHPDEQKLLQSESMEAEIKKRLEAIAEENAYPMEQIDVLISTQTLSTGISVETPIFKNIFANFAGVGTVDDALQSIERIRDNAEDYKVNRHVLVAEEAHPTDRRITTTKAGEALRLIKESVASSLTISYPQANLFGEDKIITIKDPLLLYSQRLALLNFEIHNYKGFIINKLIEAGFDLFYNEEEIDSDTKKELNKIAEGLHSKELEQIAGADDITKDEYEKLKSAPEKTQKQQYQETKYIIQSKWGIQAPDTAQVDAELQGLYVKERRNFFLLEGDTYKLKDKKYAENQLKDERQAFAPDLHKGLNSSQIELLQRDEFGLVELVEEINSNRDEVNELLRQKTLNKIKKDGLLVNKENEASLLKQLKQELKEVEEPQIVSKIKAEIKEVKERKKQAIAQHKDAISTWKQSIKNLTERAFTHKSARVQKLVDALLANKDLFQRRFGVKLRELKDNNYVEIVGQVLRLVGIDLLQVQRETDAAGDSVRYYLPAHQSRDAFSQPEIVQVFDCWRKRFQEEPQQQTELELQAA